MKYSRQSLSLQVGFGCLVVSCFLVACQRSSGYRKRVEVDDSIDRTQTSGDPYADCLSQRNAEVARLANEARDENGREPLHCAPNISKVAESYARDMCRHEYLSHTGRDGSTPADRADAAGIDFRAFGENIAKGPQTPKSAHDGWMESPRHRENILRPQFSRIGLGFFDCEGQPIWVQKFAN